LCPEHAIDGAAIKLQLRRLLVAALERHVAPSLFEPRTDWPTGSVSCAEVAVLGLRHIYNNSGRFSDVYQKRSRDSEQ